MEKASAIVVLSGMRELNVEDSEIIEWQDPDRFFAGIKLYKEGKGDKLIFTGGYSPFFNSNISEGELNKNVAALIKKDEVSMQELSNVVKDIYNKEEVSINK